MSPSEYAERVIGFWKYGPMPKTGYALAHAVAMLVSEAHEFWESGGYADPGNVEEAGDVFFSLRAICLSLGIREGIELSYDQWRDDSDPPDTLIDAVPAVCTHIQKYLQGDGSLRRMDLISRSVYAVACYVIRDCGRSEWDICAANVAKLEKRYSAAGYSGYADQRRLEGSHVE